MEREAIREWVAGRRAAGRRERLELCRRGPDREAAVRSALALIRAAGELHGWPPEADPVSTRENEIARRHWALLKQKLGARR